MQGIEKHSTKGRILEAAARLFRDKGYSATSMRDLAREVQLQPSSLYNHFESKEALLRQICFDTAQKFLSVMGEVERMEAPAAQKIEALLRHHVRMAMHEVTSVTSFNDEWRHLSEPYLSDFQAMRQDYEQRFLRLLRAGMAAGELTPSEPRIILFTLFSSMRWLYDWYKPGKPISAEAAEHAVLQLLLHGMLNIQGA